MPSLADPLFHPLFQTSLCKQFQILPSRVSSLLFYMVASLGIYKALGPFMPWWSVSKRWRKHFPQLILGLETKKYPVQQLPYRLLKIESSRMAASELRRPSFFASQFIPQSMVSRALRSSLARALSFVGGGLYRRRLGGSKGSDRVEIVHKTTTWGAVRREWRRQRSAWSKTAYVSW